MELVLPLSFLELPADGPPVPTGFWKEDVDWSRVEGDPGGGCPPGGGGCLRAFGGVLPSLIFCNILECRRQNSIGATVWMAMLRPFLSVPI